MNIRLLIQQTQIHPFPVPGVTVHFPCETIRGDPKGEEMGKNFDRKFWNHRSIVCWNVR